MCREAAVTANAPVIEAIGITLTIIVCGDPCLFWFCMEQAAIVVHLVSWVKAVWRLLATMGF